MRRVTCFAAVLLLMAYGADAHTKTPQATESVATERTFISPSEETADALIERIINYHQQGKLQEARGGYLEYIRRFTPTPLVLAGLAEIERATGHLAPASNLVNRAISIDPAYTYAHYIHGLILFDQVDYAGAIEAYDKAIGPTPDNAAWILDRGNAKLQRDDFEGAIADYNTAQQLSPGWHLPHGNLSITYVRQKNWVEAETEARKALSILPTFPEGHRNLGLALQGQQRFEEALAALNEALKAGSKASEILGEKANILEQLGRFEEAIETADDILVDYPSFMDMLKLKLRAAESLHHNKRMTAFVSDAIATRLTEEVNYIDYAAQLTKIEKHKLAFRVLRAGAKKFPQSGDIHRDLAWSANKLGREKDVLAAIAKATDLQSDNTNNWVDRSSLEATYRKYADSLKHAQIAAGLEPEVASVQYNLGWAYMDTVDFPSAITALKKSLALDPENAEARINLGYAYDVVGDYELAKQETRLALEKTPDDVLALTNLSDLLAREGKIPEAMELAQKARRLAPQDVGAIVSVAHALLHGGELQEADLTMKEARALQPKVRTSMYYYVLGLLREKQSRLNDARENFTLALKAGPNEWYRKHSELALQRLR
jgi:tetratricopeptide (TPR) repeat protein